MTAASSSSSRGAEIASGCGDGRGCCRRAAHRAGAHLDGRVLVQVDRDAPVVGLVDQVLELDLNICTGKADATAGMKREIERRID